MKGGLLIGGERIVRLKVMPISGLLLTLRDPERMVEVCESVRAVCPAEIGQLEERWLPVAVEAEDSREARDLHERLLAIPGVTQVDVIYVNYEGDAPAAGTLTSRPRRD